MANELATIEHGPMLTGATPLAPKPVESVAMTRILLALVATAAMTSCAADREHLVPLDFHVGGLTRVVAENGSTAHEYLWPGVYFAANFRGPSVSFVVEDEHNVLNVYVDDELQLILPRAGRRNVTLTDLGEGEHTVRIEKTSETQGPTARFHGFFVPDADDRRAPPVYERAIEFIGDSFTVGYGNTSTGTECSLEEVLETTNTSLAFGPLTAKHFSADYRILASSGFGMVRNYANKQPGATMPMLYRQAVSGQPNDGWKPDTIVIWLGTNDFSTDLGEDERWADPDELRKDYRSTYVEFVESLRQASPDAHIVLIASGKFIDDVRDVQSRLAFGATNNTISVLRIDELNYQGCHAHPSVADHVSVANRLIETLSRIRAPQ
jgi:lysophospholipase L1-like esterase